MGPSTIYDLLAVASLSPRFLHSQRVI